jgi:hypothetical protein
MIDLDAMDADPWPTWPVDKNELRGLVEENEKLRAANDYLCSRVDYLPYCHEIERLREALQAIAQCPIPARRPGQAELWSLAVQMQETAIAALREASDDAAT